MSTVPYTAKDEIVPPHEGRNIPLLQEILDWVQLTNGETLSPSCPIVWNQEEWIGQELITDPADPENPVCGTSCCVAGYAVIKHFGESIISSRHTAAVFIKGRGFISIRDAAQRILGLTYDESCMLFAPRNSVNAVVSYLENLITGQSID